MDWGEEEHLLQNSTKDMTFKNDFLGFQSIEFISWLHQQLNYSSASHTKNLGQKT